MRPNGSIDRPRGLARIFSRRRLVRTLAATALWGLLISPGFSSVPTAEMMGRTMAVGMVVLLAFGLFEQWPRRLPPWLERWALQVIATAVSVPLGTLLLYLALTYGDPVPFWRTETRLFGFGITTFTGLLVAPWVAVWALFRQIRGEAQRQALAFELERSELERNALDARLRLLQAQVEPHFLFNTLASVRELVDSGSEQASAVLGSLIAYLRAAVPQLHQRTTTFASELALVRAYLEIMHMRMPDRLQYTVDSDQEALELRCPPTTLLTLVENAVRHGIDPAEEGGRIDVRVAVREGRCHVEVVDTGAGLQDGVHGLGTGLATLEERLRLVFAGDAELRVLPLSPHGVRAVAEFPAMTAKPA